MGCSRHLLVEMGDAPRFHSNLYAAELAIIVNVREFVVPPVLLKLC